MSNTNASSSQNNFDGVANLSVSEAVSEIIAFANGEVNNFGIRNSEIRQMILINWSYSEFMEFAKKIKPVLSEHKIYVWAASIKNDCKKRFSREFI